MKEKKLKHVIRVFEDNSADLLEGKSLQNFINQEQAALSLLMSHSWAKPKNMKITWIPLKNVSIER